MYPSSLPASLPVVILAAILVPTASAQDRTTEQGEAQITGPSLPHPPSRVDVILIDPNVECTPYYFQPVSDAMAAGQFPPVWTVADIIASDANANAKYQSIKSQIVNIPPNGYQPQSITGDFSGFSYSSDDPNCWWTYSGCTTPKHAGLSPDQIGVPEVRLAPFGVDPRSHNVAEYTGLRL